MVNQVDLMDTDGTLWWTVRAGSERYTVLTREIGMLSAACVVYAASSTGARRSSAPATSSAASGETAATPTRTAS